MLHHSSLMLDDIEDNSMLRRGNPTAHTLFGAAQTINSANYIFVCAFEELQQLQSPNAVGVFIEELKNLHCGQALDLHWKYHTHVPTVEEYMTMVDHKTGGLFRLCVRLMQGESSRKSEHIDAGRFVTLLGRYFQIRDDYQNLMSDEVRLHTQPCCEAKLTCNSTLVKKAFARTWMRARFLYRSSTVSPALIPNRL